MSAVKVKGQLIEVSPVQEISDKFRKREVIICVTNGRYEDYFKFEAINDACQQLDSIPLLTNVVVDGYLSGRKYVDAKGETKYITNVRLRTIKFDSTEDSEPIQHVEDAPW